MAFAVDRTVARIRLDPTTRHWCGIRRRPTTVRVPNRPRGSFRRRRLRRLQPVVAAQCSQSGKSSGVTGRTSRPRRPGEFHPIYVETAARDGFVPADCPTSNACGDAMSAEDPDRIRLYLARHDGAVLAGTTMVTVGDHAWYLRCFRLTSAVRCAIERDPVADDQGCDRRRRLVYDLRGISDTLDESDPCSD